MGEKPNEADEQQAERTLDKSSPQLRAGAVPVKEEEGRFLKVEDPTARSGDWGNIPIKGEAGKAGKEHSDEAERSGHFTGVKFEPSGAAGIAVSDEGAPGSKPSK